MEVQHTAIRVSDLEETKEFYEDGLGLEHAWDFKTDEGVHNYYVTGEELDTWLQFVYEPDNDTDPDPSGFVHNAILVEDIDTTFEEIVDKIDCTIIEEPTTIEKADARAAFIEDPDGYEVEIFQQIDK